MPIAFLLTPFSPEAAGDEDPEIFAGVQQAIADAAAEADVQVQRASDIFAAGIVVEQIRAAIESADVVIGVCTGKNANVFYELGLAEILGHKPILVAASVVDLPFDVRHWRAQLYGNPESLSSLVERLRQAIEETLAARSGEPRLTLPEPPSGAAATALVAVPDATTTSIQPLSELHQLLRDGDRVSFNEELKQRVLSVAGFHAEMARTNQAQQPSESLLSESASERFQLIDGVAKWLVPAFEYRPEWCAQPLQTIVDWWPRSPTEGGSGFTLWFHFHQAWLHPLLSTLLATAVAQQAWSNVGLLLGLRTPGDASRRGDAEQLLMSAEFTWPDGLGGNAGLAFDEWLRYLELSRIADDLLGENSTIDLACGANLALGLARCVLDSIDSDEQSEPDPYALAAFAPYYCERIRWAASRFDTSEDAARALGATDLREFRNIAERWYPRLITRRDERKALSTCRTWAEAAGRA
jgi:hypothetical protein